MRYRIDSILRQNLNDIINLAANNELLLEQKAAAKRTSTINKPAFSTLGVVKFSDSKGLVAIPIRKSEMGNVVLTSAEIVVDNILVEC